MTGCKAGRTGLKIISWRGANMGKRCTSWWGRHGKTRPWRTATRCTRLWGLTSIAFGEVCIAKLRHWACFSRSSKREIARGQRGTSSSKATVWPRLRSEAFPLPPGCPARTLLGQQTAMQQRSNGSRGKPSPPRIPSSGYCLTFSRSDRSYIPAAPECWTFWSGWCTKFT